MRWPHFETWAAIIVAILLMWIGHLVFSAIELGDTAALQDWLKAAGAPITAIGLVFTARWGLKLQRDEWKRQDTVVMNEIAANAFQQLTWVTAEALIISNSFTAIENAQRAPEHDQERYEPEYFIQLYNLAIRKQIAWPNLDIRAIEQVFYAELIAMIISLNDAIEHARAIPADLFYRTHQQVDSYQTVIKYSKGLIELIDKQLASIENSGPG